MSSAPDVLAQLIVVTIATLNLGEARRTQALTFHSPAVARQRYPPVGADLECAVLDEVVTAEDAADKRADQGFAQFDLS